MPEQPELPSRFQQDMELLKDFPVKPIKKNYIRIVGYLVDPDILDEVLGQLIDDYTVAKLEQGQLISEDLLQFKAWVKQGGQGGGHGTPTHSVL